MERVPRWPPAAAAPSTPTPPATPTLPTNLAPLPRLLAHAQRLGIERFLDRPKRGVPALALALAWRVLAWRVLAWRGSGRPHHVGLRDSAEEPLLAALLGLERVPTPRTLHRSLRSFPTKAVPEAVEAACRAALPRRTGRIWAALDAHQVPYWGRGKLGRFTRGWSGTHGRRLRGYRLFLVTDTESGQVITFVLARSRAGAPTTRACSRSWRAAPGWCSGGAWPAWSPTAASRARPRWRRCWPPACRSSWGSPAPARSRSAWRSCPHSGGAGCATAGRSAGAVRRGACHWDSTGRLRRFALGARTPTDRRGPWVYVTSVRGMGPQRLAAAYRQRWRVEQAIEELKNGHDLDHLVTYRLVPNRVALGFRLLARNLAVGLQLADAADRGLERPDAIREPRAFRAAHVEGLGLFATDPRDQCTIRLALLPPLPTAAHAGATPPAAWHLPWTGRSVYLTA